MPKNQQRRPKMFPRLHRGFFLKKGVALIKTGGVIEQEKVVKNAVIMHLVSISEEKARCAHFVEKSR